MSLAPRFQAIRASAGSGKTFRLAHRYIRLLAEGVGPDEIVALTFTRKAAGEIFDAIVRYISAACTDSSAAAETTSHLGPGAPDVQQSDYVTMLRRLLECMHRLHIGTIDSFTVGIVRSFTLELGVPSSFETMDGDDAATGAFRQRLLDELFSSSSMTDRDRQRLLNSFAQARLGRKGKGVEKPLLDFITSYQEHYRALPDEDRWGNPTAIWPHGTPWLEPVGDIGKRGEALLSSLTALGLKDEHFQRFRDFVDAATRHTAYSGWPDPLDYLMKKLLQCVHDLMCGHGSIKLNRTECDLAGEPASHILPLMRHVIATELNASMARTRGIYHVIEMYDSRYDAAARREGKFTFVDIQHLLTTHGASSTGAVLTSTPVQLPAEDAASRLYIDYRLDSHLNHWLLDEFQDTSDLQWDVLANLVDEVVQDDTGRRSFFYVGDVKQAIYGWRGGNPELFDMLLQRYPVIVSDTLRQSRRSAQPIIDTVNRVFRAIPGEPLLPDGVARRWRFEEHTTIHTDTTAGCAMLLEPPCDGGSFRPGAEERYAIAAGLLRSIMPTKRTASGDCATPLTTAVLVRTNEQGKEVVDFLRRECPDMTIIHEGRAAIKDNPVVAVLLSLVAVAAHPGNNLAWRHLQMSPLNNELRDRRLSRDVLSRQALRHIQLHGFQSLLRDWGARMDRRSPLDAYGRKRLSELLAAATEFDATGSRDCDEFLDFIDGYELHEQAADDAVRVMTVHQAKGLEFDVVILPELEDHQSMAKARETNFALARDTETNEPLWALEMPRRLVVDADDTLSQQASKMEEDAAIESLCLLYVAMTRAKRALYVITSYPGKTSRAFTQAAFIKQQLAGDTKPTEADGTTYQAGDVMSTCLYSAGNTSWYVTLPLIHERHQPDKADVIPAAASLQPHRRLTAVRPSDADDAETDAAALFDEKRRRRRELGSLVHAILQHIEWLDAGEAATYSTPPPPHGADPALWETAIEHVRKALLEADIAQVFARPDGEISLWRERRFEVVRGDDWITGSFDRVVIYKERGRPVGAVIYDFKTDDVRGSAAVSARAFHYVAQMRTYRDVLAGMLGIPPAKVSLGLVFTTAGIVRTID